MPKPSIVVWFENRRPYHPESLADLAQQIHKMTVTEEQLANREYRLRNRLTLMYREGGIKHGAISPIFELDSMKVDNFSSTTYVFLRKSDKGEWELRDEQNDVVSMEALQGATDMKNYYLDEEEFKKLFPKAVKLMRASW